MMAFMQALTSTFKARVAGLLLALAAAGPSGVVVAATTAEDVGSAVVLMYHRVGEASAPSTNVTVEQFKAHLAYLDRNDFHVLSLDEVIDARANGRKLPARSVAITFDDGYRSVGVTAHPLLAERGWPYTVFVNTGPVDAGLRGHMDWSMMRTMAAEGARFANHSETHAPLFVRQSGESVAQWQTRIRGDLDHAQQRLVDELGAAVHQSPPLLAYPYGEYDPALLSLAETMGYVAFGQQSGVVSPYGHEQALPRFAMNERYAEMDGFRVKVNARALPVASALPLSPVREQSSAPRLSVTLAATDRVDERLTCFYQGERLDPQWLEPGRRFRVQGGADLPVGRSRYNCTAPDGSGRFYWFSQLWIYGEAGT